MKRYFVREIEPLENGAYQYGVFEFEGVEDKPLIQLSRPILIETFTYEWRAIIFMEQKRKEQQETSKSNERCIVCDEIIPEGRQVCPKCEELH